MYLYHRIYVQPDAKALVAVRAQVAPVVARGVCSSTLYPMLAVDALPTVVAASDSYHGQ
jgi:hypothetical protein